MLRTVETGVPVCVTVSTLDGYVLARSAFHHSVNYRSVAFGGFGTAQAMIAVSRRWDRPVTKSRHQPR